MPLLGETQAAALFPPTLLTAFSNGQLYEHMLLELVAGICTYRLLRRLGLARSGGARGGDRLRPERQVRLVCRRGGQSAAVPAHVALGIERAFAATRDGRRGGWRLIAVAGALSVYAGFPEVAYIDTLMAVAGSAGAAAVSSAGAPTVRWPRSRWEASPERCSRPRCWSRWSTYLTHADLGVHAGTQLGEHAPRPVRRCRSS